jgi:hypothetical protein
MKRLELLLAVAIAGLASFVGVEVSSARESQFARHRMVLTGANASTKASTKAKGKNRRSANPVATLASIAMSTEGLAVPYVFAPIVISGTPAAIRELDVARIKYRLENEASGTFIGEMLASHDSSLARWPDRQLQPLRIWIQSAPNLVDWSSESVSIVREAFIDWADTGIPLNFAFVLDSVSADVHVTWTDRFEEPISGKTLWSHDERWWILEANIVLAIHHRTGETLDADATRAIALHEVGHLIGLDHTADTTSIMTPRVRVKNLSAADRATAQLLYLLPPGPLGRLVAEPR